MKAERQQAKETATTNAHKAYMRDLAAGYYEYRKEQEEPPVKDESIAGPSRSGMTLTFERAALSNDDLAKVSSAKD
ncbi:hypothetical protein H0G86_006050 [Trichoderma simmonsii]|uniref:Uncharacterized protein n=1 Tax=Trichoderma simmonsii TaxID=1491479 RepID=A0A8G0PDP3_9HYPO|nr:hypothetical protein Trihar35433_1029 [Trichoderma harzianum]QYS98895.1 hypothetical protein H0G86_006050 [Trichoderma simmonsii]